MTTCYIFKKCNIHTQHTSHNTLIQNLSNNISNQHHTRLRNYIKENLRVSVPYTSFLVAETNCKKPDSYSSLLDKK